MSDMIYRQDAINVLEGLSACEEYGVEVGTDEETYIGKYEAITEISDLPSARPKEEWTSVLTELHERFDALEKEIRKASAEMSAIIREYVDRPKGEWILECDAEGEDDNLYRCSECGCNYGCQEYDIPNFCPNCGADMRGERSGTDKDKFEQ